MSAEDPSESADGARLPAAAKSWAEETEISDELSLGYGRVAEKLRALIALVYSGRATLEEIETLERHLEPATDVAAAIPSDRVRQLEIPERYGEPNAEFRSTSPVSGMANPIAPPMVYDEAAGDDSTVVANVTFGGPYGGPPGHVHGGWVAAVLDEILGRAQSRSGQTGMTGTLDIRYRAPSPLHKRLRVSATLEAVEGRRVTVLGDLRDGDTVLATAVGVFVRVDFDAMRSRGDGSHV
jgi:acyl-coenzyme A thioesterase PaaI-like protein